MIVYNDKEYPSLRAIWKENNTLGMTYCTFWDRVKKGYSIQDALTLPLIMHEPPKGMCRKSCKDHLGTTFNSIREMCEFWGIPESRYRARKNLGWSLEKILTNTDTYTVCKDHLGHSYNNIKSMCDAWNISYSMYLNRKHAGMTLEQILTAPRHSTIAGKDNTCVDHKGIKYSSKSAMCRYYNVHVSVFDERIKAGKSIEEALTNPFEIIDPFGNVFYSLSKMTEHYGVIRSSYKQLLKKGHPQMACLKIIPILSNYRKECKKFFFRDNFYVNVLEYKGIDNKEYWSCIIDKQDMILSKDEIYKRMEEIVIEEHKSTGTVQTTKG